MFRHPAPGTFFFIPEILFDRKGADGMVAAAAGLEGRESRLTERSRLSRLLIIFRGSKGLACGVTTCYTSATGRSAMSPQAAFHAAGTVLFSRCQGSAHLCSIAAV